MIVERSRSGQRWFLLAALGAVLCLVSAGLLVRLPARSPTSAPVVEQSGPTMSPPVPGSAAVATPTGSAVGYPAVGHRTYTVVAGTSPVIGRAGQLVRFQVAVETDISGLDPGAFAQFVERLYGAPQGWTAGGDWRFQRVGPGQAADFVLYLVTPATRDVLCQDGYDRYTSCRKDNRVVLNIARWVHGVPGYGAPLSVYRDYMINHETGHRLYFGHERCPGRGELAPVMQQQTLGLHGCLPNAWPYPGGRSYHGSSGVYPA